MGMDEINAFKIAEGFGSGMGGLRHTCGAVTAMFMVASYFASMEIKNKMIREDHVIKIFMT